MKKKVLVSRELSFRQLPGWGRRRDALLQEYLQSQASNNQTSRQNVPSASPVLPSVAESPETPATADPATPVSLVPSASTLPSRSNLSLPVPPDATEDYPAHEASNLMSQHSATPHLQSETFGSVPGHSDTGTACTPVQCRANFSTCRPIALHMPMEQNGGFMTLLSCQARCGVLSRSALCDIESRCVVPLSAKVFPTCRSTWPDAYLLDAQNVSSRGGCSERGQVSSFVYSWPA